MNKWLQTISHEAHDYVARMRGYCDRFRPSPPAVSDVVPQDWNFIVLDRGDKNAFSAMTDLANKEKWVHEIVESVDALVTECHLRQVLAQWHGQCSQMSSRETRMSVVLFRILLSFP